MNVDASQHARAIHCKYIAITGIFLTALVLCPFALAKTEYFRCHSSYFYDPIIYDKYRLSGQKADLLLIGDSALAAGILPKIIEQQTGWKTYNLGVPLSSFAVHPDVLVDRYLANNSRPKVMVLYLSFGSQISNHDFDLGSLYEAGVTLLWQDNFAKNAKFYLSNPRRLFAVSAALLRSFVGGFDARCATRDLMERQLSDEDGFVPLDAVRKLRVLEPSALSRIEVRPDRQYIEHFRLKYTKAGYVVIVALSPIPDCDPSYGDVVEAYRGLLDVQPYQLPCSGFVADGRFHMVRSAAENNTVVFSKHLSQALKSVVAEGWKK